MINNAHLSHPILIPKNSLLEKPIFITHAPHETTTIIAEENSQAIIIESCLNELNESEKMPIINTNTEIFLSRNSYVQHITLHPTRLTVHQHSKSRYELSVLSIGKDSHQGEMQINLNEPEAFSQIRALLLAEASQKKELNLTVHHHKSSCESNIKAYGIINNKAKSFFAGNIIVHLNASKTKAHLENKNLLLSEHAEAYAKPNFEIYNDDVQCAHGATMGYLDQEALFYLESRGIPKLEARKFLISAFIQPILKNIPNPFSIQIEDILHGY